MADVLHRDQTGIEVHEPKNITTATSGQVYVATGTGTGNWTDQPNRVLGGFCKNTGSSITTLTTSTMVKVIGTSTLSSDSIGIDDSAGTSNRLRLITSKPGNLFITGYLTGSSTGAAITADIIIVKNSITVINTLYNVSFDTTDIQYSINAVDAAINGDYYEIWITRLTGTDNLDSSSFCLQVIGN